MIQKLNKSDRGFTLVEIMIVVAIIGLLAAIALPSFMRARKRSQATTILDNCRILEAAKDQYAIDTNKGYVIPNAVDLVPYLKTATGLYEQCLTGGFAVSSGYGFMSQGILDPNIQGVWYDLADSSNPIWLVGTSTFSDVVDASFWSPYPAN